MLRPTVTLAALAFAALTAGAATGAEEEGVTPLLHQTLAGTDGMEVNMLLFDAPGGFETPRHLHPGHTFMYVIEGAVELDVEGQPTMKFVAGQAAYEIPNTPMVGRNLSTTEGARLLIFSLGETGTPLELPAPE